MPSSTADFLFPTTTSEACSDDANWAEVDHPYFYYDPKFKSFCLDRLTELRALRANWDGEQAPEIDLRVLEAARAFVKMLPRHVATRPMVVPVPSGGLQFEWHDGKRLLEIEFESPETVHYLKWDPENNVEEEDIVSATDRQRLVDMIRWFMKGLFCDR